MHPWLTTAIAGTENTLLLTPQHPAQPLAWHSQLGAALQCSPPASRRGFCPLHRLTHEAAPRQPALAVLAAQALTALQTLPQDHHWAGQRLLCSVPQLALELRPCLPERPAASLGAA